MTVFRIGNALAEGLVFFPDLRPGTARWAADKNVGVVHALFVCNPFRVLVMAGKTAIREKLVGPFAAVPQQNNGGRRSRWIVTIPKGVDRAH